MVKVVSHSTCVVNSLPVRGGEWSDSGAHHPVIGGVVERVTKILASRRVQTVTTIQRGHRLGRRVLIDISHLLQPCLKLGEVPVGDET